MTFVANGNREVISLDVDNFGPTVESGEVVVIDISAEWCGPCQAFTAVFHEAAASTEGVLFGHVDTDTQPELGAAFNVTAIPTVAVMRGGVLIFLHEGSLSARALNDVIRQAKQLDPDQVCASVTEKAAK